MPWGRVSKLCSLSPPPHIWKDNWDIPGSQMVNTTHFHCKGHRSISGGESSACHAVLQAKKKKKNKKKKIYIYNLIFILFPEPLSLYIRSIIFLDLSYRWSCHTNDNMFLYSIFSYLSIQSKTSSSTVLNRVMRVDNFSISWYQKKLFQVAMQ